MILDEWFNFILTNFDPKLNLIVYLQTDPEILFQRIKSRNRKEEKNISKEYLQLLHALYENWFMNKNFPIPAKILIINGNQPPIQIIEELNTKLKILE